MAQPSLYTAHLGQSFSSSSSSSPSSSSKSVSFAEPEKFRDHIFHWVDEDGDGKISPKEITHCLRVVGEEITEEEAKAMMESEDLDGDGYLRYEELERLAGEGGEGEEERRRSLIEAFEMYAGEEGADITPWSLRRTLSWLGEVKTIEDCRMMIRRFDLKGDGVLSFDEFEAMMV